MFTLWSFDTLGVEKNNDDAKRNYFSSNKHDAAREILVTEARQEELREDLIAVIELVHMVRWSSTMNTT